MLTGCKEKAAPPPPQTESKLTIELFKALEKNKHKAALNKVKRLREINKASINLVKLQNSEVENIVILETQECLDKNDIDKAVETVSQAIKTHGKNEGLSATLKKLISLQKANRLIDSLNTPENSLKMAKDIVALKKIIELQPQTESLTPFIKEKTREALELEKWEKEQAVFDLLSDIDILISEGKDGEISSMLAEAIIEKHNSTEINCCIESFQNLPYFSSYLEK
jgi:hypothetical protein